MADDHIAPVVALVDTRWVGHHPTFFRECASSLIRLGCRVLALCPQPKDLEPHPFCHAARLDAPNESWIPAQEHDPATTLLRWHATRRALDQLEDATGSRADLVFFPYLDNFLRGLPLRWVPDLVLARPWSGLYFRTQHLRSDRRSPRLLIQQLAKGDRLLHSQTTLPLLAVLDERFAAPLSRFTGRPVSCFPDITDETTPAEDGEASATLLRLARGRPIIGLAGSLERRKGVLTFLRTAEASAAAGDHWFFAAVGTFAEQTFAEAELAWIHDVRNRLPDTLFLDLSQRRIPDGAVYNSLVSTFAVSWAAYEEFTGSSNTLTKAALLRIPVLATAGECIGARVEAFHLGATIPEGDHLAARAAIRGIFAENGHPSTVRKFDAYHRLHSRAQLDAFFVRLLAARPPSTPPCLET
jgi:hypothetical protein